MVLLTSCSNLFTTCNKFCGSGSKYGWIWPVLLVTVYTLIGGYIFMTIERPHDEKLRIEAVNKTNATIAFATKELLKQLKEVEGSSDKRQQATIRNFLRWFAKQVGAKTEPGKTPWTFWGAVFFAGTVYTTIGYGHYTPVTVRGRVAVIFYAIIGIPLVLTVLNYLGQTMIMLFKWLWRQCIACGKCMKAKAQRRKSEVPEFLGGPTEHVPDDPNVPLAGALLIFLLWMLFCAAVFLLVENTWTYFESFYFFFVSLTTIGFGDLVLNNLDYSWFVLPLLIIGLSVISMCISIIQAEMEELFKNLLKTMQSEYKSTQTGDGLVLKETGGDEEEGEVEQPDYGKFMKTFAARKMKDRFLMKCMNKSMKKQLSDTYEKYSSMRNRGVQTDRITSVNDLIYDPQQ